MNTTDTHSRASTSLSSSLRFAATLFVALGLTLGLSVTVPQTALAQNTYTVTSTGDAGDANPGDGNCDDGNGNCTLRAAIDEADADPNDEDTIEFGDIAPGGGGPAQITPGSELVVDETVTIDGTTEDNYTGDAPTVLIDGSSLPNSDDDGLFVSISSADGSTVQGLAVVDAPMHGLNVGNSVTIQDCYVGISTDGTTTNGNGEYGIWLFGDENQVSGSVIGGNDSDGIRVRGSDNIILNNQIGVGSDGTTDVGNGAAGVRATGSGNFIGACIFGCAGNTISGNDDSGIQIDADNQTVVANNIGTDESGTSAIPNNNGIAVESNDNTIGGGSDQRNLISGNTFNGIRLGVGGGDAANNNTVEDNYIGVTDGGGSALPNGNGCVEGGVRFDQGSDNTITSNVIAGNNAHGIYVRGPSLSNTITDNLIGTNGNSDALGNNCDGIQVDTDAGSIADENEIHDGNVIAFNDDHGVDINGSYGKVTNNFVGTNANGDDLGNNVDGVNASADFVLVGRSGVLGEDGNIIGHNGSDGIDLNGVSNASVRANYIGTNANDADLGNGDVGIEVREANSVAATDNEIGHLANETFSDPLPSDGGDGNVVAYNGGKGITVEGTPSTANPIRGNSVYQNGGADDSDIGIDLGDDGSGAGNDNGDGDDGPNRLQNHPVNFDVTNCDDSSTPTTVNITFTVRSNTGGGSASTYPLQVDFYVADSEAGGEGKTYLQTEEYPSSSANSPYGFTLSTDEATCNDYFVATATDDRGNTSEFFGPPGQQLPVELASFEAAQNGESDVELRWTTASETNNAGFRVQHRASGEESWTKLSYVASKASGGTTTEAKTYRFDAEDLAVGTHEFRLKQMDLDGTAHLHDPVDVELQMQQALRLKAPAPNPVQGQAQLSFAVRDQTETTITMYNPLGQKVAVVYRGTPAAGEQQTAQVTTDDLASGVYFLRLQADGRTKTQKMTVVR